MVETTRNPNWTRDELLVALDYYLENRDDYFSPTGKGVLELTARIGLVAKALGLTGSDTLRNAAGVSMKLLNFRSHDPEFETAGLTRGNKLEKVVWQEYADRPAELRKVVATILNTCANCVTEDAPVLQDDDEPEAQEGRLLSRLHRYRERDRSITKRKKASFINKHGRLFCEACYFDFTKVYGERGDGFMECHHTKPVSEIEKGQTTTLADLVLLCANCHRMVHSARPWWSMDQLRAALKKPT
ncbi:HNH endonuclease [Leisingera methylohalidivorans]|uniref:HNH endonuclease n=1 Tax=Leisingera methylohalidivorans DSM 14336 TaxID=999552 RepID=V9VR21_9RHOB|nr:HNH endonuclease [Leisingera methylohalidivorans]AHD00478.1 HNH endonuclease [Leisingera methylohalidivorans DSM 14336]